MEMWLSLDLLAGEDRWLYAAVQEHYRDAIAAVLGRVRARTAAAVASAVRASPEFVSLTGGGPGDSKFGATLKQHFGLADPGPVLEGVVAALAGGVLVERTDGGELGGVVVSVGRDDYSEVLAVPGTSYLSNGHAIDWLNWLLLAGERVILADTTMIDARHNWSFSRAGGAVMRNRNPYRKVKGKLYKRTSPVVPWHVPPEWAGVAGDNWLDRTLEPLGEGVLAIVGQELEDL